MSVPAFQIDLKEARADLRRVIPVLLEAGLQAALDGLVGTLDEVVAKGSGGHLTFYSLTDVVAGTPNLSMIIAYDEQGIEDALNSLAGTLVYIAEHGTKTLIFYS